MKTGGGKGLVYMKREINNNFENLENSASALVIFFLRYQSQDSPRPLIQHNRATLRRMQEKKTRNSNTNKTSKKGNSKTNLLKYEVNLSNI